MGLDRGLASLVDDRLRAAERAAASDDACLPKLERLVRLGGRSEFLDRRRRGVRADLLRVLRLRQIWRTSVPQEVEIRSVRVLGFHDTPGGGYVTNLIGFSPRHVRGRLYLLGLVPLSGNRLIVEVYSGISREWIWTGRGWGWLTGGLL